VSPLLLAALERFAACHKPAALVPGARVVCRYRVTEGGAGQAHLGTLLAIDDPRAWAGSLAFPDAVPDPELVKAHVARCIARGDLRGDERPVLWDFGKVYWDSQLGPADLLSAGLPQRDNVQTGGYTYEGSAEQAHDQAAAPSCGPYIGDADYEGR
jgi:hypothetical protein